MKIAQFLNHTHAVMTRFVAGLAAAMVILGVTSARTTLLTVYDYPFENNATPAGFTVVGSPTYGGGKLVLNGSSCLAMATPVTATDNFVIEVICTPTANDLFNFSVGLNNGANNGWGLLQNSGTYQAIAEGVGSFGTSAGAATLGTPVRLALVRSGGVAKVYKNGVAQTATSTASRAIPTVLTIGANQSSLTPTFEGWFKVSIDELRVFTFFPGLFDPATDLLAGPTLPPVGPDLTWDNGASTMNWSGGDLNWSGSFWQNSPPASAIFGAAGIGTVNLTEAITASAITFNNAGYTLAGGSLALMGTVTNNANAVMASVIAWGSLTKQGTATLTLTGAAKAPGTWGATGSGATHIDNAHFAGAGTLTVISGPTLTDYDNWVDPFFPGVTDPLVIGDAADPDRDGVTNRAEYAFGLVPNSGTSVNPITVPLDKITGTFTYTVWTSTNLAGWTEDPDAHQSAGPADPNGVQSVIVTLTTPPLTPSCFIQVRAN